MKKMMKIFLPILVMAIAVSLLFIPSEAAASEGGYSVWKDEASFLAGEKPIYEIKNPSIAPEHISGGGYLYAYGNLTLDSGVNIQIDNGVEVVIDLNGYELNSNGSLTVGKYQNYSPTTLTVKNGTLNHKSAQLFKPQHNSTTVLDNMTVNINPSWGNFIYGTAFRNFIFKNSTVNYAPTGEGVQGCSITSPTANDVKNLQAYASGDEAKRDFEMNIVFDNSFYNATTQHVFILLRDVSDTFGYLQISFINGAGFNTLGEYFLSWAGTYESWVNVNIECGAKFKAKEVPQGNFNLNASLNYYNSITFTESGRYVVLDGKTALAPEGHVNVPGTQPLLIWGFSGDADYPHSLCHALYTVNFFDADNAPIAVDMMGYSGYADGAVFNLSAVEEKLVMKEVDNIGKRVFRTVQAGWATSSERTDKTDVITVTGNASYYAVSADIGPASVVEFASPLMREEDVLSAIFSTELSLLDLRSFDAGSYVKLYDSVSVIADETVSVTDVLTIDLGGNALTKKGSMPRGIALFSVDGGVLNITSGRLNMSALGLASVSLGGTVNLTDTALSYDSYPAFIVGEGTVNMTGTSGSALLGRSGDINVPAFLLSKGGLNSNVNISKTEIALAGPLATHAPEADAALMNIAVTDCDSVQVLSVFTLYSSVADKVHEDTVLTVTIDGSLVASDTVFDIAPRADGSPAIKAVYNLSASSFTSDPRDNFGGEIVLPGGYVIIESPADAYKYTIVPSGIEMKFNLALSLDFIANFYIKRDASILFVDTYLGRTPASLLPVTNIEGVDYYLVSFGGISPSDALDAIVLSVGFTGADTKEYIARFEYSPTDYFDALLNSTTDPLGRRLSAAAMNYVKEAYEYSDCALPEDFEELLLTEKYTRELRSTDEIPTVLTGGRLGNIANAFSGAQLYLSSNISFRFNLRESFSGTVVISGHTYSVVNGKVGALGYIEVSPDAALWYSSAVVIGGDVSGEYSLMDYAGSSVASSGELSELLVALYRYCYEATVYTEGGVLPPYIEGTPAVDVTYR